MKVYLTEKQLKKLVINEETLGNIQKDYISLNDIWYGFDKLYHGDFQSSDDGPLHLVQQKLFKKFPEYAEEINFRPDKDFGDKTSKMIGKLFGVKFKNLKSVSIGPKTLEKLGFKRPPSLTLEELILVLNFVMEESENKESDIKGIANVILNRSKAGRGSVVDVVLEPSQFSGWNKHQPVSRNKETMRNIMLNRPKDDRYQNRKSWELAVKYAKLLLNGGNISDNTKGATHYYNPNKIEPPWGQESKTWIPHPPKGLDHIFGRDTTTKWSKNFTGR
tara:strand:+ start:3611 stop:4438 length:828 start_codon:yes stop_codon:yes gene_type:complete